MDIGKTLDSATRILIDPCYHDFTPVEKGLAWTATVVTAILSLGTIQIFSVLWRHLRQVGENDTHRMISELFHEIFGEKEEGQGTGSNLPSNTLPAQTVTLPAQTGPDNLTGGAQEPAPILQPEPSPLIKVADLPESSHIENITAAIETCVKITQNIEKIITYSKLLDEKIKEKLGKDISIIASDIGENTSNAIEERLKVTFFKFDIKKWEKVLADLETALLANQIVTNGYDVFRQCELDLVEALAEYNVEEPHILNNFDEYEKRMNAFLDKTIKLPGESHLTLYVTKKYEFQMRNRFLNTLFSETDLDGMDPEMSMIIREAKQTCKASLEINQYLRLEETLDYLKFAHDPTHATVGPYFQIILSGCECVRGNLPDYRNPRKWGIVINFDWLIGKRQGDRLVIPTEGEQYIIRLNQQHDGKTLEEKMIQGVVFAESLRAKKIATLSEAMRKEKNTKILEELNNQKIEILAKNRERRKLIFQQLEDAYGKDLLNNAKEKCKIKDPRDLAIT